MVYNWNSIDWNQNDTFIAKKLGCSKERVRQKRLQLKKPKSPKKYVRAETKVSRIAAEIHKYPRHSNRALSRLLGVSNLTVSRARKVKGLRSKATGSHTKIPKSLTDWRLPDSILAKIWGLKNGQVCRQARIKAGYTKNIWGSVAHGRKPITDPECQKAIENQKIVAQNWKDNESLIY